MKVGSTVFAKWDFREWRLSGDPGQQQESRSSTRRQALQSLVFLQGIILALKVRKLI